MDWIDQARKQRKIEGNAKRGPINPKNDPRCFRREMVEELLDSLNYCEWARDKGEINRHQWKKIDSGIRSVIRCIEAACSDRFLWEMDIQKVLNEAKQEEMICR